MWFLAKPQKTFCDLIVEFWTFLWPSAVIAIFTYNIYSFVKNFKGEPTVLDWFERILLDRLALLDYLFYACALTHSVFKHFWRTSLIAYISAQKNCWVRSNAAEIVWIVNMYLDIPPCLFWIRFNTSTLTHLIVWERSYTLAIFRNYILASCVRFLSTLLTLHGSPTTWKQYCFPV